MTKKTYFITGGCGFIGSAVIRNLLKNKNNIIVNIDKLSYASNTNAIEEKTDSYIFIEDDINNNKKINKLLKKYKPNFIIHLAAESHVDRSIDDSTPFIESNILGTYSLLTQCYKFWKNLKEKDKEGFKFLHVSTDEVYGSTSDIFSEDSPMKPNSPYAASKASSDLLVRAWFKTFEFPILITNCSNNYGKWQFPEKLIPLVIKKCIQNEPIPIYGNGKQERDWIHVDDHVEALLKVLLYGKVGQTYNIASSKETSNLDVVKKICSLLDELRPIEKIKYSELISFVDDRPGHDNRYSICTQKIEKELNWKTKIDFSDGLRKTIIWYLDNEDWLINYNNHKYSGKRLGRIKK